jgi:hypothetical protein
MSSIPINFTYTQTSNITSMRIEITQLILFTSCQFRVTFFNENGELVKSQILNMSGSSYMGWCDNDQYVLQWIKNELEIS